MPARTTGWSSTTSTRMARVAAPVGEPPGSTLLIAAPPRAPAFRHQAGSRWSPPHRSPGPALAHRQGQPATGGALRGSGRLEPAAVVRDGQDHDIRAAIVDRHGGPLRVCVSPYIARASWADRSSTTSPDPPSGAGSRDAEGGRHLALGRDRCRQPTERFHQRARLEVPRRQFGDDQSGLTEVVPGGRVDEGEPLPAVSTSPRASAASAARDRASTDVNPCARVSWISRDSRSRSSSTPVTFCGGEFVARGVGARRWCGPGSAPHAGSGR